MSTYIEIYRVAFTPATNALVDELESYLKECIRFYSREIQYQKLSTDIELKLDMPQARITDQEIGNYCAIKQDGITYYYFILEAKWVAQETVRLKLSIDSINTFRDAYTFNSKTTIVRQHFDRFSNIQPYKGSTMVLKRRFHDVDEGITAGKHLVNSSQLKDDGDNWFLAYVTDSSSEEQVSCYLLPESRKVVTGEYPDADDDDLWSVKTTGYSYFYFLRRYNPTAKFTISGTTYSLSDFDWLVFAGSNNNTSNNHFREIYGVNIEGDGGYKKTIIKTSVDSVTVTLTITGTSTVNVSPGSSFNPAWNEYKTMAEVLKDTSAQLLRSGTTLLRTVSSIDRTDSRLLKLIECPYCPVDLNYRSGVLICPDGWYLDDFGRLSKWNLDAGFSKTLDNVIIDLPLTKSLYEGTVDEMRYAKRDDSYESKLYNSSFYSYKVAYDDASVELQMERITAWTSSMLSINYKQSDGIVSDCGFRIDSTGALTYNHSGDYDFYILSKRNNESPIYTSAYLNYLRTGYNYDRKNQVNSNVSTWVGATAALAGAVTSAIAGATAGATGGLSLIAAASLGASAITTIATAISNTVSSERSIQQKLDESRAQATQVSSCDDLSMMSWYSGNKLWTRAYSISDGLKRQVGDLFYYCGYACNIQGVPDFSSRYWFNYVQCEPVFNDVSNMPLMNSYLADIQTRFSKGVTVFHCHGGDYDWEQQYENWEVGLIDE